jgi:hypothetical protein
MARRYTAQPIICPICSEAIGVDKPHGQREWAPDLVALLHRLRGIGLSNKAIGRLLDRDQRTITKHITGNVGNGVRRLSPEALYAVRVASAEKARAARKAHWNSRGTRRYPNPRALHDGDDLRLGGTDFDYPTHLDKWPTDNY